MNAGLGSKMYKTLRLSVLTRILDDKAAVRGTKTSGFITLRSYSGKSKEKDTQSEIVPFYTFLDNQINRARRSFLFNAESKKSCGQLISLCEKHGKVKCVYNAVLAKGNEVVLIEMEDRKTCQSLYLSIGNGTQKHAPRMPSPFLSADYNSLVVTLTNFVWKDVNFVRTCPVNWKKLPDSPETLWSLYQEEKMSDFSLRLRFLVVLQMNNMFTSLWNNTLVFPFGGSVNGFGSRFSDLDLTMIFTSMGGQKFLTFKSKMNNKDEDDVHNKCFTLMSKMLRDFVPGCECVVPISSARVPIVKFYQEYVDLECDISIESESGLMSTEMLYIIGYLHSLVKPLVIVIKKWAKMVNITSKSPGKRISNYGLLSMVIFFLQQRKIGDLDLLPPLTIFPLNSSKNMFPPTVYDLVKDKKARLLRVEEEKRLLNEAVFNFFDFYSNFNFRVNGISIKTGKIIPSRGSPLYIENPLDETLNVAKQVGENEIRRIKAYFHIAKELYKKNMSFTNNFFDENYYTSEINELTKGRGGEKRGAVEGHVN